MVEADIIDFPNTGRLLGIDPGSKRIGLAVSDEMQMISSPLSVLVRKNWKKDSASLSAIIEEHNIKGIVIGYPINMDGSKGPRCQSVEQFARNLKEVKSLPITLQDERLSSQAVERTLLEADMSREKRKQNIDKMAASYILQSYLDRVGLHLSEQL